MPRIEGVGRLFVAAHAGLVGVGVLAVMTDIDDSNRQIGPDIIINSSAVWFVSVLCS